MNTLPSWILKMTKTIKEDSNQHKGGKVHGSFLAVLDFMKGVNIGQDKTYLDKLVRNFKNDISMISKLNDASAVEEVLEDNLKIVFSEAVSDLEHNDWSGDQELIKVLRSSDPTKGSNISKEFLVRLMNHMDRSTKLDYSSRRAISMIAPMLEAYTSGRINSLV